MRLTQFVKAYWGSARMEYLPAELPALFIPILLASRAPSDLIALSTLEGILAFSLLFLKF